MTIGRVIRTAVLAVAVIVVALSLFTQHMLPKTHAELIAEAVRQQPSARQEPR
jgi:uncharacterized protein YpmB